MTAYLRYLPEFDNYGIEKSVLQNKQTVPEIRLAEEERQNLLSSVQPKAKVGFLLGQDQSADGTEFYTIDKDYLTSLLNAGADLRFIDYDHAYTQTKQADALVLPGGSFDSPKEFYVDTPPSEQKTFSKRAFAYLQALFAAKHESMPILGICAGAQMMAALYGRKMYSLVKTAIKHQTSEQIAHDVLVLDNQFQQMLQTKHSVFSVNSRHKEALLEEYFQTPYQNKHDLKIFAISREDNIPEAWGNLGKGLLGIQWHPENMAARGDKHMQNIYNWIVLKAQENHSHQKTDRIQTHIKNIPTRLNILEK